MRAAGGAGRAVARLIDRLTDGAGRLASLCAIVMIALGAFNAIARYTDRWTGLGLSSNAFIEGQWYLFSVVFLLAGARTLRENRHVRVDLLYSRLGKRGRAWIDLAGTVVFLLPFSVFALWVSYPSIAVSWRIREGSPDPDGLARYPIKTVILIAFGLLALQGVSELIKLVSKLASRERFDGEENVAAGSAEAQDDPLRAPATNGET